MLHPDNRLALYMEGALGEYTGKLGYGLLRYSPHEIVAVIDSRHAGKSTQAVIDTPRDVPVVASVAEAHDLGADTFVLGIAPPGGLIPDAWRPDIAEAVAGGMNVVNGLHEALAPQFQMVRDGQFVWDVRREPEGLQPGTGAARKLANRRVLMIGTDMSIGKMTAGLEIVAAAKRRGLAAEMVATGQIGMILTGSGVPLDAIRVDFASGAIERELMKRQDVELVVIEGQGSLVHPGSSATLPLLRGSMPTHLVLCHRAGQTTLSRLPDVPIPELGPLVELYQDLAAAGGIFPRPRLAGCALITAGLDESSAVDAMHEMEEVLGVPCTDPVRYGAEALLPLILSA